MNAPEEPRVVRVPRERMARWADGFAQRHGGFSPSVTAGAIRGTAPDGSWFEARPPFGRRYDGTPGVATFVGACAPPDAWGVLLVRKGGFAVARLAGERLVASKVGQRHVQGRTKAGGQSQQRFARRRSNQAREAYEAAADHAARILLDPQPVDVLVAGGDRAAVDAVLSDRRLAATPVVGPWLAVPDPRRAVLDQSITDAAAVEVRVWNAPSPT